MLIYPTISSSTSLYSTAALPLHPPPRINPQSGRHVLADGLRGTGSAPFIYLLNKKIFVSDSRLAFRGTRCGRLGLGKIQIRIWNMPPSNLYCSLSTIFRGMALPVPEPSCFMGISFWLVVALYVELFFNERIGTKPFPYGAHLYS